MSEDQTRIMRDDNGGGYGDDQGPLRPEDQQRHLRYLVIGLLAVIAGLIVAVIIISGSDSSDSESMGTTDTPAVVDPTPEPVTPTGETGSAGDTAATDTDSGGVSPEPTPDTGTTDSGGTTPDNSGGISPDGSGTGSGNQSGGITP